MPVGKASKLDLDASVLHLLHRAAQCANDIFDTELSRSELTPRQLAVLDAIAANEGASQTTLVEITGIDRSTLADIMRRMIKKGLVQRRRTKTDARAYAVALSEEGRRALKRAGPAADRADLRILEALPASSRNQFVRSLTAIVDKLVQRS